MQTSGQNPGNPNQPEISSPQPIGPFLGGSYDQRNLDCTTQEDKYISTYERGRKEVQNDEYHHRKILELPAESQVGAELTKDRAARQRLHTTVPRCQIED